MASGFSFTGASEMQAKLRAVTRNFPKQAAAALYQEAQVEMTESKKRCPVDKGILRASGHVMRPVQEGRKISVDLAYGGAAEDYAIVQHEALDFQHTVGQAKFLESVLLESASNMAERVARRVQFNEGLLK